MNKFLQTILFAVGVFFLLSSKVNAQNKCVVYTLDESGSMNPSYYVINYNLQLLTGLLDKNDELYIVRGDESPIKIDLTNKTSEIQKISRFNCDGVEQDKNLAAAYQLLQKSTKSDKFLILAGDGKWYSISSSQNAINTYEKSGLCHTVILGIGYSDNSYLGNAYRAFPEVERLVTSKEPSQLKSAMESLAKSLIGSDNGLSVTVSSNNLEVTTEMPVSKILVMAQNLPTNYAPNILSAKIGKTALIVEGPYKANRENLYGTVYHLTLPNNQIIPKGKVIITYDGVPNEQNTQVIPILSVDVKGKITDTEVQSQEGNTFYVCLDVDSVSIEADISLFSKVAPMSVLKKTKVYVDYQGTKTEALLKGNTYYARIPYVGAQPMPVSISARYNGYFQKKSNIFIVDRAECMKPKKIEVETKLLKNDDDNPDVEIKTDKKTNKQKVIFKIPKKGKGNDYTIDIEVKDIKFLDENGKDKQIPFDKKKLSDDYDIEIIETELPVDKVTIEDGKFKLKFKTNFVCNCLLNAENNKIKYRISSKNKDIEPFEGIIDADFELEPWWIRCRELLLLFLGFLAFLWYVVGIIRKPRFAASAYIERKTVSRNMPTVKKKYVLKTNFINRFLVPYIAEKNTVDGIKFIATRSKGTIRINKKSLKGKSFILSSFTEEKLPKMSVVKMSTVTPLQINGRVNNKVYELKK